MVACIGLTRIESFIMIYHSTFTIIASLREQLKTEVRVQGFRDTLKSCMTSPPHDIVEMCMVVVRVMADPLFREGAVSKQSALHLGVEITTLYHVLQVINLGHIWRFLTCLK